MRYQATQCLKLLAFLFHLEKNTLLFNNVSFCKRYNSVLIHPMNVKTVFCSIEEKLPVSLRCFIY